ncbi:hypothetical protein NDI43_01170 [Microcoleus vaginatus GB2-A3]|uniref:hypothetical protein n=1 Tax=Microcoleus vaginatus TaxID=119532 RepID=UPI0032A258F1
MLYSVSLVYEAALDTAVPRVSTGIDRAAGVLHKPAICCKLDVAAMGVRARRFDAFPLFVKDA